MLDLIVLIKAIGYLGIFVVIFAESFIVFFLPGDSLLIAAGLLAKQGFLNIYILAVLCFVGAVLGNHLAYFFGRKVGPKIFNKPDSFWFNKSRLEQSRVFYERYGPKTIVLARFIPFIRTFAPILAGVGKMHYGCFLVYNITGAMLWAIGLPFIGYFLGQIVPNIDRYILFVVAVIIIISLLPLLVEFLKTKKRLIKNRL